MVDCCWQSYSTDLCSWQNKYRYFYEIWSERREIQVIWKGITLRHNSHFPGWGVAASGCSSSDVDSCSAPHRRTEKTVYNTTRLCEGNGRTVWGASYFKSPELIWYHEMRKCRRIIASSLLEKHSLKYESLRRFWNCFLYRRVIGWAFWQRSGC